MLIYKLLHIYFRDYMKIEFRSYEWIVIEFIKGWLIRLKFDIKLDL